MVKCRKCNEQFSPSQYQIRKSDYICRLCSREYHRQYRVKRKQAGNPIVPAKMSREWHRNYARQYFANTHNRLRRSANMRKYMYDPKLRMKHEARWQATHAKQSGALKQKPCEVCGDKHTQMHHDNYYKPLEVRWLCRKHHIEHHAKAKGE